MRRHPLWLLCLYVGLLAFDYTTHPALVMFLLYVREPGGAYDWSHPKFPIMLGADGTLVLSLDCRTLPLWHAGPWQGVLRAISRDGPDSDTSSGPSNEITFWWSAADGCVTHALTPPTPPPPSLPMAPASPVLPAPPPIISPFHFPPQPPFPPVPPSGGQWITETCQWTGSCR